MVLELSTSDAGDCVAVVYFALVFMLQAVGSQASLLLSLDASQSGLWGGAAGGGP